MINWSVINYWINCQLWLSIYLFCVSLLLYDSKLNVFRLWTKQDVWGRHLGALGNTDWQVLVEKLINRWINNETNLLFQARWTMWRGRGSVSGDFTLLKTPLPINPPGSFTLDPPNTNLHLPWAAMNLFFSLKPCVKKKTVLTITFADCQPICIPSWFTTKTHFYVRCVNVVWTQVSVKMT